METQRRNTSPRGEDEISHAGLNQHECEKEWIFDLNSSPWQTIQNYYINKEREENNVCYPIGIKHSQQSDIHSNKTYNVCVHVCACTLAEDLMPLIIARHTIAQAARRQPDMMPLNSPDWSMESEMSRAFLNQKYEVGELAVHSFTKIARRDLLEQSRIIHNMQKV